MHVRYFVNFMLEFKPFILLIAFMFCLWKRFIPGAYIFMFVDESVYFI